MTVMITGSTGMVGRALIAALEREGTSAIGLMRPHSPDRPSWDIDGGRIRWPDAQAVDAVVHLAGENVGAGRWTAARKRRILDSRVRGTRLLVDHMLTLAHPPQVLICASAVGYYGDRGDEILDEQAAPGAGFAAEVCSALEREAQRAAEAGIRVVCLRLGAVLSRDSGALARMVLPFRLGLGGPVGSGRQFMSWIALADAVDVIREALANENLAGPVNAVAPGLITNAQFANALGRALRRPALLPLPAFMVRLLFGQMGQELLLASTRVVPARLQQAGFEFRYPDIDAALAAALGQG